MPDMVELRAAELRRGELVVLRDITLRIQPGGLNCIVGANGSGKTTLLRAMCGDNIGGVDSLTIDGHDARGLDEAGLAALRAVLPQAMAPHFPYAVRDLVSWGAYTRGGATEAEIVTALANFGIAHLASRPVTSLSGGEWARVRIAQAFLQQAAVLFVDEPDAALDRPARTLLFTALAATHQTVVVVTHDLESALRHGTHVIGLSRGSVAFHSPIAEVTLDDCEALWE